MSTFVWDPATYDQSRRRLIPCFDAFYGTVAELVATMAPANPRILDLGAGTGLLAGAVSARVEPGALVLLDGSAAMLERAALRLAGFRPECVKADFTGEWPAPPSRPGRADGYDVIMSALAIHHLDDAEKQALFGRARAALAPGGVFINADQVAGEDAWLDEAFTRHHLAGARARGSDDAEIAAMVERMRIDRYAPAAAQVGWLRDAGFVSAGVFFQSWRFAVFAGWKAPRPAGLAN